jgi:hypothetical protein
MASLRARKKKKPTTGATTGKGKKTKICLLDLDNYVGDSDDEDKDGGDLLDQEQKELERLDQALTGCVRCGLEKYCKISKTGAHINLTFNQRCGWANALVRILT